MRTLLTLLWMASLAGCASEERAPRRPNFVRFDVDGSLLVTDNANAEVVRLSADGAVLATYGERGLGEGQLWHLRGLAPDGAGGFAVISHRLRSLSTPNDFYREVKRFNSKGQEIAAFPALAPGEQEAGWPEGIERVEDGWVVVERQADALLFFDAGGALVRTLRVPTGGEPLADPTSPRLVGDALWMAEHEHHRIRSVGLDGRQRAVFGVEGTGPGELRFPWALAVAPDGTLVVADLGNYRVQRFRPDGSFIDAREPRPIADDAPPQLLDVDVAPDGRVAAVDSHGGRVLLYGADGELLWEAVGW